MRSAQSLAALSLLLVTCALLRDPARGGWALEWNQRIDVANTPFEHPCATKAFIAWADGFLVGCDAHEKARAPDCDSRLDWVDERVDQCREWTAWQLRNFNKHERSEGTPPSMRIE